MSYYLFHFLFSSSIYENESNNYIILFVYKYRLENFVFNFQFIFLFFKSTVFIFNLFEKKK